MKNKMILGNDDSWRSYGKVSMIKEFAKDKNYPDWKETKKDVILWNKIAKQLHKYNENLTSQWNTFNTSNHNHILSFINRIFYQVKQDRIRIEDIGKICILENGTRGLSSTLHMQLWNVNKTSILDANDEFIDKYHNF